MGPPHVAALTAQVQSNPDATLTEHCARWEREQGVRLSTGDDVARLGAPRLAAQKGP